MDITRFLPKNEYDAAINANAPTAGNPFATIADIPGVATLSSVLTAGNTSGGTDILMGIAAIKFGASDLISLDEDGAGVLEMINNSGATSGWTMQVHNGSTVGSFGLGFIQAIYEQTGLLDTGKIKLNFGVTDPSLILESDNASGGFQHEIVSTTPTADRVATLQNASGIIAYLADIPAPTGDGIYSGSGTVPPTTLVTLTNNITFGSTLKVDGSSRTIEISDAATILTIDPTSSSLTEFKTTGLGFQFIVGAGGKHFRFNSPVTSNLLFYLNGSATGFDLGSGSGAPVHRLYTEGANTGMVVFNEIGAATGDLRVEGDTDPNLLFTEAGLDKVGIGLQPVAASSKLTIAGDVETTGSTEGLIVLDRSNATRYRIYTDGGVLNTEAA